MPPLPRRSLRTLVRKLGANARPAQQKQSLAIRTLLCRDGDQDSLAAIISAGVIPPLVQLLAPRSADELWCDAAHALMALVAWNAANTATIAAAGAIPPLVQLLGTGS
ncbi:hypothetical protein FOA52_000468 [Chlamydomonas sp. UWO 241]|nr:hypothetical protein FOA52_000468 [Chlamydomonas sp. UWO 241]